MAIQISGQGSREAVTKHIQGFTLDEKTATAEEVAQLPAFKAFLISEIEKVGTEFNGVNVIAQGTAHKGHRHITADVIPIKLHL